VSTSVEVETADNVEPVSASGPGKGLNAADFFPLVVFTIRLDLTSVNEG